MAADGWVLDDDTKACRSTQNADGEQRDDAAVDDQSGAGELVAEIDLIDKLEFPYHYCPDDKGHQYHPYQDVTAEIAT